MLAAATSFFARTAISQSYNIGTAGSRPSTPGHGTTSVTQPTSFLPSLYVGLWRVQSASHKVTNKRVSVWSFDKRGAEIERLSPLARERTLEILKAEVGQKLTIALLSLSEVLALGFRYRKAPTSIHPR
jgi:SCY1-like protein 2